MRREYRCVTVCGSVGDDGRRTGEGPGAADGVGKGSWGHREGREDGG